MGHSPPRFSESTLGPEVRPAPYYKVEPSMSAPEHTTHALSDNVLGKNYVTT